MAQAGKDMAERQLVGVWLSSVSRVVHSLAVAGCFGDGDLSMASGYLSLIGHLVGTHTPAFAQVYDAKLGQLAASTEELSAAEARDLFHGAHLPTMHETMVDCPVEQQQQKPKLPQQQRAQRQQPAGGGGPPPAKRPREEQQQPPRGVAAVPPPKADKGGGKGGAPGEGAPGKGAPRPRGRRGQPWKP